MNIKNTNKQYHHSPHITYSCQYHVIFCPKYRRPVLTPEIQHRTKQIFTQIATEHNFTIIEQEIMPDHVHLLIDCNPRYGITNCIKELKGKSAHQLREEYPQLKSKLPCLWTRSAFISTCGEVSLETVKQYIQDQKGK